MVRNKKQSTKNPPFWLMTTRATSPQSSKVMTYSRNRYVVVIVANVGAPSRGSNSLRNSWPKRLIVNIMPPTNSIIWETYFSIIFFTPGKTSTNLNIAFQRHYTANRTVTRAHGPYWRFPLVKRSAREAMGPAMNSIVRVQRRTFFSSCLIPSSSMTLQDELKYLLKCHSC